ncbi:Glycosyl transferase, family 4 [uncultured Stenotrophomonas sp.]|uniref:Glycosyl transferase, family 4 n=1 Tax=uncultured Stenotrophomonas sp. TaxID=165438 RepID=A0A1Y5Q8N4_9GAMM|nr:Glycosyl transferase, family 4 [uncultured Stenotrophomonas sp.]
MGFAAVFLLAALLTWAARGYALRRNLFDQPGERRSHKVATPRGGGIAIVISQVVAYAAIGTVRDELAVALALFSTGLLLVAGIGWWDDHRPLSAKLRLCVHVVAGALLGMLVWQASGDAFKAVFSALLAIGLINVWNFMDGINGLATTQAILAAIAFALLLPMPHAGIALSLAAGCLGFLPFNFPKARIFMGDVGSGALGYLLAGLVALGITVTDIAWPIWLLPLTAFLVDSGFTLLVRMLRGERWMEAHTQHLYQAHVKRGRSHAAVTLDYAVFSVAGLTLCAASGGLPPVWGSMVAVAWAAIGFCIWYTLRNRIVR